MWFISTWQISLQHQQITISLLAVSRCSLSLDLFKVMLHGSIRNDDFKRNTALQHCCDSVSNGYSIVSTLQRFAALEIVVANCPA